MALRKAAAEGLSSPPGPPRGTSDDAGRRLKRVREGLGLRYRDVLDASTRIAERHANDEFTVLLSRLSDIENKCTQPSIFRLYSLCTIYRLDLNEVLSWYGVDLSQQIADAASIRVEKTHLLGFDADARGDIQIPLALDPGFDPRQTSYLSRMMQRWGKVPLVLLNSLDIRNHRYGFIGSEDWSMYPLIQPGALVMIDEKQRRISNSGWANEFERPIFFFEHRGGFACCWCTLTDGQLVLQPHPASMRSPEMFRHPEEIEVIGQVTGIAMHLDPGRRRPSRA